MKPILRIIFTSFIQLSQRILHVDKIKRISKIPLVIIWIALMGYTYQKIFMMQFNRLIVFGLIR